MLQIQRLLRALQLKTIAGAEPLQTQQDLALLRLLVLRGKPKALNKRQGFGGGVPLRAISEFLHCATLKIHF